MPKFMHPFGVLKYITLRFGLVFCLVFLPLKIKSFRWHRIDVLLFTWLFAQVLSTVVSSPWPDGGFKAEGVLLPGILYLLAKASLGETIKSKSFALIFVLPGLAQSVIGLLQYLGLFLPTSSYFLNYESQVFGTVGGANVLGAFLAVSLPFVYFTIRVENEKQRVLWAISLILILIVLILTKSRGAWVATAVGLIVYKWESVIQLLKALSSNRRLMYPLTLLTLGALSFLIIVIYKLNPDSASGRLFIWSVSWDMFMDNLWTGVGFGNFGQNWLEHQGNYFAESQDESIYKLAVNLASAHSQYLHILAETGILGIGIFLAFLFSILSSIYTGLRRVNTNQRQVLLTLTAALATLFTHALVDDVLRSLIVNLQFMIILSLLILVIQKVNYPEEVRLKQTWKRSRLLVLILLIPLSHASSNKITGEILWKEGQEDAISGNWDCAISKYMETMKYLPNNSELDFYLGAAYAKTGNAKKALELIKNSQKGLSDKNQYITLGKAYIDNGQYELAERILRQVLRYYPGLLNPHFWLSRIFYEQGDLERARSELQVILDAENILNSTRVEMVKEDARLALNKLLRHNDN